MDFNALINKPGTELELLDWLIDKVQSNYSHYQNKCFFMKLGQAVGNCSEIIWTKEFPDAHELGDFYWDTKFQRACIMLKFEDGRYEVLCQGFRLVDRFEIWPDRVSERRLIKLNVNREKDLMYPRELVEKAFGEITEELKSRKGNKAI